MWIPIVLIFLLVGCAGYVVAYPSKGVVDFVIKDPLLASLWESAAQEWTNMGVICAARVTVNVNPKGVEVSWAAPEEMAKLCGQDPKQYPPERGYIGGCNSYRDDKPGFKHLWIARPPDMDEKRLRQVVMHEMIHAIVPTPDHLPIDEVGIMMTTGSSDVITVADMQFICARTECVWDGAAEKA